MKLAEEIKFSFIRSEGLYRIMAINIVVFLLIGVAKLIFFLAGAGVQPVLETIDLLAAKSNVSEFILQPWSLITYMFVHENFLHILFNMIILFWTGKIFCEFLGSRKVVAVYLLGGIAGALLYMLAYNLFPAFSQSVNFSKLIGASAGVIAVLTAIATLSPDYTLHLILFGPVRLKYIAIFLVLLYVISIPDGNAGGNISHLGGALFGFLYIKNLKAGRNLGSWLESFLETLLKLFQPTSKLKTVHRSSGSTVKGRNIDGLPRQEIIDAILDKISRSGYSSLTKEERDILFKVSKNKSKE